MKLLQPTLKKVLAAFGIALVAGAFGWWAGLMWWECLMVTIKTGSIITGVLSFWTLGLSIHLLRLATQISELHTRSSDWGVYVFALAVVPIVMVQPLLMASTSHVVQLILLT